METIYQVSLIASMVVGIGLVVYSIFIYSRADGGKGTSGYFETANTLKFMESSIDEIDKTMDELHETSKHIFEEMENKYKELLLLYSLIEEKKKELADLHSIKPTDYKPGETLKTASPEADELPAIALSSPNIRKVRQLQQEGLSLEDTAKRLGIGKGEVKLMLDLGKIK
ncbi:MAG: hypothetical protein FWE20_06990 [Defluviitaleaceae bacterium]|nr:hypothetical protein [Defluviitaleaceae bacterium]